MFWRKRPEGMARIQGPLLIKYPTVEGQDVRIMVQHIVAIRKNPDGDSTFLDCSNGLSYHVAMSEAAILTDLNGYKY